jgi:hypothetical protein
MRTLIVLIAALVAVPALAADLMFSQDFETPAGWEDDFRSGAWNYLGVLHVDTTSAVSAHYGTMSIRGNLFQQRPGDTGPSGYGIDPVTGLENLSNPQLEWAPDEIVDTADSGYVYVEFWMKLDHSTWAPTGGGKTFYITDTTYGTAAYYWGIQAGTGNASLSSNGAWMDEDRANWGYSKAYMTWYGDQYGGPDGQWYKFGILMNYNDMEMSFYMNGDKLLGSGAAAEAYGLTDGNFPMADAFEWRGLQILYVANSQIVTSTDGNGYACGYQLDDFKVYDYLPDYEPPPPTPPSGPLVSRDGRTAEVTWDAATLDGGGDPYYYMALARENDLLRAGTIQTRIAALSATLYELDADATTRIYVTASDSAGAVTTTGVESVTDPE